MTLAFMRPVGHPNLYIAPQYTPPPPLQVIVEDDNIPGEGHFTAYQDGRLRVCFEDRTILHMNSEGTLCKLLLPDGASVLVSISQPVGVEAYVLAALRFRAWAFKPHAQRVLESGMQARVQVRTVSIDSHTR